jgi:hypothetical protein
MHKKKPVTGQKKPTIGYIIFSVCDFYTQSEILTRTSVFSARMSVILTRMSLI